MESIRKNCPEEEGRRGVNLVFLHGSYHGKTAQLFGCDCHIISKFVSSGSWCWAAHFFDYFCGLGFDTHAFSFAGQGLSDFPNDGARCSGSVGSHADAVMEYISSLDAVKKGEKVAVVAHSFAGLILMKALERSPTIAHSVALLHSVPPTGNSAMVGRFLRRTPLEALKLSYAFISRNFEEDSNLCRDIFFSPDIPEHSLLLYQRLIKDSCKKPLLDLRNISSELPITPRGDWSGINALVLGSSKDKVVDVEALEETADIFSCSPVILDNVAHDSMIDKEWEAVAAKLGQFLEDAFPQTPQEA